MKDSRLNKGKEMKYEIDIDGLPKGWDIKELKFTTGGIESITPGHPEYESSITAAKLRCHLIVEKIQSRRIVLEETEEKHLGCQTLYIDDTEFMIMTDKVWREVKETDIPLTNSESKLSLSVDECRNVRSLIKDFENLGWFVNPARSLLLQKITEFIKDK